MDRLLAADSHRQWRNCCFVIFFYKFTSTVVCMALAATLRTSIAISRGVGACLCTGFKISRL